MTSFVKNTSIPVLFSACNKQFDVAFVIDRSGSMEASFEQQLNFVREVIYGLPWQSGRTRVGVVLYDNNAKVDFRLDTYT